MALVDETTNMRGVGTNPALILRAPDYISPGAELYGLKEGNYYGLRYTIIDLPDGGTLNIAGIADFFENKAVFGRYNGQELMNTNWFSAGTLMNNVVPTIYMWGWGEIPGASGGYHSDAGVDLIVYKRDPRNPDEEFEPTTINFTYRAYSTDTIGTTPRLLEYGRPANQFYWFDARYEYKFKAVVRKMLPPEPSNGYTFFLLEGFYFQHIPSSGTVEGSSEVARGLAMSSIGIVEGVNFNVTTDATGAFSAEIDLQKFSSSGIDTGNLHGNFNSIDAIVVGLDYNTWTDTSTYLLVNYGPETGSSLTGPYYDYTAYVYGSGFPASTVCYLQVIIYGSQRPREV